MTKKPTVTSLQSGFNSTETLNANFEALRDGFDNTLSLDGSTPNAMEADLDLNGNNIIGATGLLINGTDYLADVEAAKTAAQAAQAAAETAETNAETAETNAEASETAAGLSATAAATSATASAASAVDATNNGAAQVSLAADQVTLAAAQVTLAETAKTGAELAETNAETAESNAATSATNAATSETNASTSASTASTKASEAATSATNAATSATEAETAKTGAETARDSALAALDSFDDRYLGVKTSDPTVDNDGDALVVGAIYYNSNTNLLYVYNGTTWQVTANAASGDLVSTNNLSDLTSAATARTNLGLGTAATTASTDYATAAQGALADTATQPADLGTAAASDTGDFATAAQGTLADSATQPSDLATVATSGAYSDLTGKPTLGTAAATASTDYATAAQGTLADSAVQPNDSPTFEGLTIDKTSGDTTVTIRTTGTGDADATLVLDSADTGESVLQFDHDGVYGAMVQWYTDGSPDLNITTVGATSVIDMQPNGTLVGRFDTSGLDVTGTVTATSFAGDGAGLTNAVSTAAGAVGTYAHVATWGSTSHNVGNTVAGSSLFTWEGYSSSDKSSGTSFSWAGMTHTHGFAGTWRWMSAGNLGSGRTRMGLAVRIS